MIKKIVNLNNLYLKKIHGIENHQFLKIYDDLNKIGFFDEEQEDNKNSNCRKVYTILKTEPGFPHQEWGEYIYEELFEDKKFIKGKVYNFYLEDISERQKTDLSKFARMLLERNKKL